MLLEDSKILKHSVPCSIKGLWRQDSNNSDSVWKKPIRISPSLMVVAIPESIVQLLHLDDQRTWFEQIPTREGLFLKISSKEILYRDTEVAPREEMPT
jgi:hypothetical protein